MGDGEAADGEVEVDLLDFAVVDVHAGRFLGARGGGEGAGFGREPAVEAGGEGIDDFVVVYSPGDGYDGVAG